MNDFNAEHEEFLERQNYGTYDEPENEFETLMFLLENAETEEERIEIEWQLVELSVAMEIKEEIEGGWKK